MPPVLGPVVAVVDALEVLGRGQRRDARPVAQHEQRALRARPAPPRPRRAGRRRRSASPDSLAATSASASAERVGDEHALAGGQAVGLHDPRARAASRRKAWAVVGVVEGAVAGGGHAGLGQHLLHEGLGPLEPGAVGPGPEHQAPVGPQPVGEAVDQRCLGADDEQVGVDLLGRCVGHAGDGVALRRRPVRRCPGCPG